MKTTIKEVIDGLYETIRLKLVSEGKLPDIKPFIVSDDQAGYISACKTLKETGTLIEIVNDNHQVNHGNTKVNTIYITYEDFDNADHGRMTDFKFNPIETDGEVTGYEKYQTPDGVFDLSLDIRYVVYDATSAYYIEQILLELFNTRGVIQPFDMDNNAFNDVYLTIYRENPFDVSDASFTERGWKYRIKDVDLIGDKLVNENVPKVTDFEFGAKPTLDAGID